MSIHKPRKPSGRVAFDEQGNASWEWQSETGTFSRDIDTVRMRTIGEDFHCEEGHVLVGGHNPYDRSVLAQSGQPRPQKRTLDDMRRLSEEIKAAREKKDRGQP